MAFALGLPGWAAPFYDSLLLTTKPGVPRQLWVSQHFGYWIKACCKILFRIRFNLNLSICGRIYRIKQCLPESLYKQIYHSLFESHLGYAISVWGGISSNQLKPLFVTQKKCVRILFGDFEKYADKFNTCARTRPINKQNLGSKFYEKESTKPLFTKHELLAVENLYRSRCIMEMFKTVKSHVPISLFCLFNPSSRKDNLLITPNPTHQFIYKSAWLWNQFRNTTSLTFSSKFSAVKNSLTQSLLGAQCRYGTEWNNFNFTEF